MTDWRTSQLQRETIAAQNAVAALDAAVASLEDMLSEAYAFEGEFEQRRQSLQAQRAAIRSRVYPIRSTPSGHPASGLPASAVAEYEALKLAEQHLEEEQQRLVHARMVRTHDAAGLSTGWSSISVTDVSIRLDRVRIHRAVAAGRLAELAGRLTPGELVQTGVPAPDLTEHRARLDAVRERHGLPASA